MFACMYKYLCSAIETGDNVAVLCNEYPFNINITQYNNRTINSTHTTYSNPRPYL